MSLDRPDAPAPKLVVRLPEHGWLGGVCAGIGGYLGVPPLLLRVAFVLLASWRMTGVLAYFLVWLIVPLLADSPDAPGLDAHTRAGLRTVDKPAGRPTALEWGQLVALALFGGVMVALAALAAVAAGRQAMRQDAVLAVREDW